jgi:pyruvate dehydrogenase E2 component (dihydrolipoamide acetyltransferase)
MAELLRMPEVAAGAESAVLSSWPLTEGTSYSSGDVVAIIETDKAVVDVEAESAGSLVRRLVAEGAEVAIGDPIALIAAPGESVEDVDSVLAALGVGAQAAAPQPVASAETAVPVKDSPALSVSSERIFASPLARRIARESGIALEGITGTGPNGRIRRRDVEAAKISPPVRSVSAPVSSGSYVDVEHSRLRQAIAKRLTESKTTAPHFYLRGSARVDRLMALRAELNDGEEVRISVNDLVIKAVAASMMACPDVNVIWTETAIRKFADSDIAVAISTDRGLVTPVLRGVNRMSIREIAAATKDLAQRARAGQLKQHELEGGATSITNLGMFGTEDFDAIINPPHSSILAVGAAREVPVVADGALSIGQVMKVSLSVDHRPIDGAVAAEWMQHFIALLEAPAKILA